MRRGYRSIVVAAVGWLSLCGAQPTAKHAQSATELKQVSEPDKPPFAAYPGYDPDRCYHSKDHDAADLCAQWRAAIAAETAAHEARRATTWAIIATLLSALGTAFIVWTFSEQRATSRRELRAYLFLHSSGIFIEKDNRGRRLMSIGSNVEIKNSGATPAYNVRHWGEVLLAPISEENNLPLAMPKGGFENAVPAGGSIWKRRGTGPLPMSAIKALKRGQLIAYVYGRIEYEDTFGRQRETTYRMAWTGWPIPHDVMMNFAQAGNTAT